MGSDRTVCNSVFMCNILLLVAVTINVLPPLLCVQL